MIVGTCASLIAPCFSQTKDYDEATVRAVYAKLTMASRVHAVRLAIYARQEGKIEPPNIVLSNFGTGDLSNIRELPVSNFITKAQGLVLRGTPGEWQLQDESGKRNRTTLVALEWIESPYSSEDWNVPLSRILPSMDPHYTRYVSFTVTISYQGRDSQYSALFLLGQDARGKTLVFPADPMIGASALNAVILGSVVPDAPVAGFGTNPLVQDLVEAFRSPDACIDEPVTGLCCDQRSGHCGVHRVVVSPPAEEPAHQAAGRTNVLAPVTVTPSLDASMKPHDAACGSLNYSGSENILSQLNTNGHTTFSHGIVAAFTGSCSYNLAKNSNPCAVGPCIPTCHVEINNNTGTEKGITTPGCHFIAESGSTADTQVSGATCSAGYAVGVTHCISCVSAFCSVSFTGAGASIGATNANVWSWTLSNTFTCR